MTKVVIDGVEYVPKSDIAELTELRRELAHAESKLDDYRNLVSEMREALQTVFALAGEDPQVEEACSKLIDESRHW
jgi:hypothetical protein